MSGFVNTVTVQQIIVVCEYSCSKLSGFVNTVTVQQIIVVCEYSCSKYSGFETAKPHVFVTSVSSNCHRDGEERCFCVLKVSPKFWGRLSTFLHFHSGWREQRFSAWNFSTNVGNFVLLQKLVKSFSIYFPKTGGGGGGLDRNKRKRIAIIQTRQVLTNRRRRRRIR